MGRPPPSKMTEKSARMSDRRSRSGPQPGQELSLKSNLQAAYVLRGRLHLTPVKVEGGNIEGRLREASVVHWSDRWRHPGAAASGHRAKLPRGSGTEMMRGDS